MIVLRMEATNALHWLGLERSSKRIGERGEGSFGSQRGHRREVLRTGHPEGRPRSQESCGRASTVGATPRTKISLIRRREHAARV